MLAKCFLCVSVLHSHHRPPHVASPPPQVDLPVDKGVVLLDIGFTGSDPNHGEQDGALGGSSSSSSEQHPVVGAVQKVLGGPKSVACLVRVAD